MRSRSYFLISGACLLAVWLLSFVYPTADFFIVLFLCAIAALAAVIGFFKSKHRPLNILVNTCVTGALLTATFYVLQDTNFRMSMAKYGHCFQDFNSHANRVGLAKHYDALGIDETLSADSFLIEDLDIYQGEPMREWSYSFKTTDGKYSGTGRGDGCGLLEAQ